MSLMNTVTVYMTADRFWDLLSKKISGEASQDELNEFAELTANHPDWQSAVETLSSLWQQPVPDRHNEAAKALELHLQKMQQLGFEFHEGETVHSDVEIRGKNSSLSKARSWWITVGAIVVIVMGFLVLDRKISPQQKVSVNARPVSLMSTKSGSPSKIQLPDGSNVWLNASSELTYDKDFDKNLREVTLTGEAFFDVVRDPEHPFIIHTKVIDVKVLGTQFNVKAYPDDSYTEASLIRGSLEVTVNNRPNEKHLLKPKEKVSVPNNINGSSEKIGEKPSIVTEPLTYYHVDSTIIETSWVDNKLVFQENETFSEVALKMERRYGVHIIFPDKAVGDQRIYGSFTKETIDQALDALKEVFKFNYKIIGNDIIITQ
jgi:ferric-dicitrate binding protein FerR (iron transport regulator)